MIEREQIIEIAWTFSAARRLRFIDLTHVVGTDIPKSKFPRFTTSSFSSYEKDGAYSRNITVNEHLGTHVDAPCHFAQGHIAIDKVSLSSLIGPAAVFNVSNRVAVNADYRLNLEDINSWENRNGEIPQGAMVLLSTGWDKRWYDSDKSRYLNIDTDGKEHFPGIATEVFEFLAHKRDIKGVGTDCFRPEGGLGPPEIPGTLVPRPGHNILCSSGKLIIENLRNLDLLPESGALIILGVIPYEGGSGGQARAIGILP